jgi:hypothetical protein
MLVAGALWFHMYHANKKICGYAAGAFLIDMK